MNRCASLFLVLASLIAGQVFAQDAPVAGVRSFPADVLQAELTVEQWPGVIVNGQRERAAPGTRILGQKNQLVLPGRIAGVRQRVNYRRNFQGQVNEIWILTPAELRQPLRRNRHLAKPNANRRLDAAHYEDLPSFEAAAQRSAIAEP